MKSANQLAEKIIKELQDAGCSPDQMLSIIKLAKEKYVELKKSKKETATRKNRPRICAGCGSFAHGNPVSEKPL